MTELRERVAVTQADIDAAKLYLQGNGPWKLDEIGVGADDYLVQCFARHRLAAISAVMQDIEAPSEAMIEFAARAIINHNWPNMPAIDVDEMWDGQIGNAAAAIKAAAQYRKEQA